MSQAEALLNRAAMTGMYTATPETEPHIVIGPDRVITIPNELKRLAVQFDHNIETVVFDCPRYWDDADMSEMNVYINYKRNDRYIGCIQAENVAVDEVDQSMMHFDWRITKNVTMVSGELQFLVCIKKSTDEEEEIHWNSELCDECYISEGMEYGEVLQDTYPDVLSQLQRENQESMAAVKAELLEAKANGEFNPVTSIESITGGVRISILVGAEERHIDLMHGSTSVIQALVEAFMQIGSVEPTTGPALWLDSEDGQSGTLYFKNKSGVSTPIYPTTKLDNVVGLEELTAHLTDKDNPHNVKPVQIGAMSNEAFEMGSTDGVSFICAVPGLTELKAGMTFTFVPRRNSASTTPSLNINSLGSYPIYRRIVGPEGGYAEGSKASWITTGIPMTVMFTGDKWLADMAQADVSDVRGTLPVENGGTGKTGWSANRLLFASAIDTLGQLAIPAEIDSVLMQSWPDAPRWASLSGQINAFGALRFKYGSYVGQNTAGNRDLGVTPKVLFVRGEHLIDKGVSGDQPRWFIFLQGHEYSKTSSDGYNSSYEKVEYTSRVKLTGSTLVFSLGNPNGATSNFYYLLNASNSYGTVTYEWFALY